MTFGASAGPGPGDPRRVFRFRSSATVRRRSCGLSAQYEARSFGTQCSLTRALAERGAQAEARRSAARCGSDLWAETAEAAI